jgi:energy-coupling factor transporter ATP-binding protein EcfA2
MKQIEKADHITIDMPMQRAERTAWVDMPMPSLKTMDRFLGWALGRLLLGSGLLAVSSTEVVLKGGLYICERLKAGFSKLFQVYDSLPLMGQPLQAVVVDTTPKAIASIPSTVDLLEVVKGKHLLIIGATGSGKSTIAQFLASRHSANVRVYDPDCSPSDWVGLTVFGRKGNFNEINAQMQADLVELEQCMALRGEGGDSAIAGRECCMIGEEFPLLADEVDIARDWLLKFARRGRRVKQFIIVISQSDSVSALGIEGDGAIRQSFAVLRLGKFAVAHAKKLKDEGLIQWLQAGKYRATLDDEACQLPDVSGYQPVTNQLPRTPQNPPLVTAETPAQSDFKPDLPPNLPDDQALKLAVGLLVKEGVSESKIIKEVLGYQGGRYQQGKELFSKLTKGQ